MGGFLRGVRGCGGCEEGARRVRGIRDDCGVVGRGGGSFFFILFKKKKKKKKKSKSAPSIY